MGDILLYTKELLPPIDLMESVDPTPVEGTRLVRPGLKLAKSSGGSHIAHYRDRLCHSARRHSPCL